MFFLPAVFALLGYLPSSVLADAPQPQAAANVGGEASAIREYFYVGGSYVPVGNEHLFANQMYVEKLKPSRSLQPFPLVFIHGNGQSGTNWLNKPDGGPGWATYFLRQGYTLYIIDQTERSRSPWDPYSNTTFAASTAENLERRFTAAENFNLWPQASLHTQWPGTGLMGDPIFDTYFESTVQYQSKTVIQETKMQAAGSALLKKIGPAVLISHSQGGLMPWAIADSVPSLVRAIVSIEPTGPPFEDVISNPGKARPYGITNIPLTYSPATTNTTSPLETQLVANSEPGLANCIIQAEPARQLVNLKHIPVLVESGESSFHVVYDGCTVKFLQQAGVSAEWLKLGDIGIHGNGHLQFMEKNSDEIAGVLDYWIRKQVR